jgi:hypothetical protein
MIRCASYATLNAGIIRGFGTQLGDWKKATLRADVVQRLIFARQGGRIS